MQQNQQQSTQKAVPLLIKWVHPPEVKCNRPKLSKPETHPRKTSRWIPSNCEKTGQGGQARAPIWSQYSPALAFLTQPSRGGCFKRMAKSKGSTRTPWPPSRVPRSHAGRPAAQLSTKTLQRHLMVPLDYKSTGGLRQAAKRPLPTHLQGCRETALPASQVLMRPKAFGLPPSGQKRRVINPSKVLGCDR